MSTKQKFGLDSIKKGIMRTKQKMVETFSKGEKTVDLTYDQLWSEFKKYEELVVKLKKVEVDYIATFRKLLETEKKLGTDISNVIQSSSEILDAISAIKELMNQIDNERDEMERTIQRDFFEPLTVYMRQFGLLKQRNDERGRRLIDMDRYNHDYKVGLEKNDTNKSSNNKKKFYNMKKAYIALNQEMLNDLPLLFQDKDQFFGPLFATHVQATSKFFQSAFQLIEQAWNYLMHINKEEIFAFASVITDDDHSCWNKQIDLVAQVNESEYSSAPSSNQSYQQPNQSYQQPNQSYQQPNQSYQQPNQSYQQPNQSYQEPPPQTTNVPLPQRPPMRPPNPGVKKARAIYPFQAQDQNELSFNQGDILILIDAQEGADWWTAELNGHQGSIPSNYVQRI